MAVVVSTLVGGAAVAVASCVDDSRPGNSFSNGDEHETWFLAAARISY